MNKNILSNLYYRASSCYPYCFKEYIGHVNFNYYSIDRKYYRIYDLRLWFESDFQKGEKLIVKRVSEKSKYDFNRKMRCFL